MAWEYLDEELVTLCFPCHEGQHEFANEVKALLAKLPMDGPYSTSEAVGLIAGWAHEHCGHDLSEYKPQSPLLFAAGAKITSTLRAVST